MLAVTALLAGTAAVAEVVPYAAPRTPPAGSEAVPGIPVAAGNAFRTDMRASNVIGQSNFVSRLAGPAAANLTEPTGVAFDAFGDLWVADTGTNRVLEFSPPFVPGMNATLVIGQSRLMSIGHNDTASGLDQPRGVAFDASGDLWVADSGNNRLLEFVPPFRTGMNASVVLGQASFTTDASANGSAGLYDPADLAFLPSGELVVSDTFNNRLLGYAPPFVDGESADLVIGQSSFGGVQPNTTATNLSAPFDLAATANGSLWVADAGNARALGFFPPLSSGMPASIVLGESSFTSTSETLPLGMYSPEGIAVDRAGDVWVSDPSFPNRVTEYTPPIQDNENPSVILGQVNNTSSSRGVNRTEFNAPFGLAFDPLGELWVVDSTNNRVLEFGPAAYPVTFTESGLPAKTPWSVTFAGVTQRTATGSTTFSVPNGSYAFSVPGVGGYSASPSSGSAVESGSPDGIALTFSHSSGAFPVSGWMLFSLLLLAIVVLEAVLLAVRGRKRTAPATGSPPPAASGGSPSEEPRPGPTGLASEGPSGGSAPPPTG